MQLALFVTVLTSFVLMKDIVNGQAPYGPYVVGSPEEQRLTFVKQVLLEEAFLIRMQAIPFWLRFVNRLAVNPGRNYSKSTFLVR